MDDLSNVSQSPSQRTPDSPNLHCRLQQYMNKESSPIETLIPKPSVDEKRIKMRTPTLQKTDIQNADIANVLPRVSSSPQKLSQTEAPEEPAFTCYRPPKLPFLREIHQLKHKEMDTEHKKRNSYIESGQNTPINNGLHFLNDKSIQIRETTTFARNNSETKQDALNTVQASPTEQECAYICETKNTK